MEKGSSREVIEIILIMGVISLNNIVQGTSKLQATKDLESTDILSNPLSVILGDTFSNPSEASDLLLLQLDVTIENCVRELLEKCELIQVNFLGEKPVFEVGSQPMIVVTIRIAAVVGRRLGGSLKERTVLWDVVYRSSDLFYVVSSSEVVVPFGEQSSNRRE